mmetsp:Transcript_30822/g.39779  ORF Transcript_30822/g.39779 Transcript_30822/m.39779 type:complete len:118 (-) Transcript_30822:132-485(-)
MSHSSAKHRRCKIPIAGDNERHKPFEVLGRPFRKRFGQPQDHPLCFAELAAPRGRFIRPGIILPFVDFEVPAVCRNSASEQPNFDEPLPRFIGIVAFIWRKLAFVWHTAFINGDMLT